MRILHIDTGREMRGGQWQALYLMQGLSERSIEFRLLSPRNSALFQAASKLGFDVRPLRSLLTGRFDAVHAHDARAHSLGLLTRRPLIVSRRVAFPIKRTPFSRLKYRRASHYLAVSDFVRRILVEAGIPPDTISVVYDGVRLPDRIDAEYRTLVLALDSSDPGKGRALLEKASKLSGIPVRFSSQLVRDLPQAVLFIYITGMEGLGSAALLAMAHGAAVIASRVGGLPEIVEDGITGVLTANDPASIAAAMQRVASDRPLMNRLALRARAAVERSFTVTHMVENTIRAYERILA